MIRAAFLTLVLLSPALPGAGAEPPAPGLPADVAPLPADAAMRMDELMEAVEKYRGLQAKRPVPAGVIEETVLRGKVAEEMREELPPEVLRAMEAGLQAFGLLPADLDLARYYPELLTSQVAGYYDPKRKYLSMVHRNGGLLGPAAPGLGDQVVQLEEMLLVHELTHALQDQHFNLETFVEAAPLSDAGAARLSLVEGDATLTMFNFHLGIEVQTMPGIGQALAALDSEQLLSAGVDLPGIRELADAPAWLRETLLFSYIEGYSFCISVRQKGGQALLDHSFTQDPPRSSEQILHPEKWHTRRDDPVGLSWPDLSRRLPGFRKVTEGELGELGVRILFQGVLQDAGRASAAAAGWGGDRFALYEKGGRRVLAWITEWDTEADAQEALAAAKRLGDGWQVDLAAPRRVVALRWARSNEAAGLLSGLAAAPARRPENRDIDLAVLGIKDKEVAASGAPPDAAKLLQDPAVQQLLQEEKPAGVLSDDGATYTNAALGFTLTLPAARRDWTLQAEPPIPMAALRIGSPDGSGQILFTHQEVPGVASAEEMKPFLEVGMKAMMPGYESLGGSRIEVAGASVWEEGFRMTADGRKARGLLRTHVRGGRVLVVMAMGPEDRWTAFEPALREILGGLVLTDLK